MTSAQRARLVGPPEFSCKGRYFCPSCRDGEDTVARSQMLTFANTKTMLTYVHNIPHGVRAITPKEIGAMARQARTDAGLTQQALAKKIGASRFWVSEFEHGKARAELGLTLKALRALDLTVRIAPRISPPARTSSAPRPASSAARIDLAELLARASRLTP